MKPMRWMPAALLLPALYAPQAQSIEQWQVTFADVLTGVVPLGAGGLTYYKDDKEGREQWLWSTATSLVLINGARLAFKDHEWSTRPNGHPYGFPSGHLAFIGSGAAFLQERYGYRWGIPAWTAAGYVAWVRVEDDHHHWRDVIVSSAVAYGVSRIFVQPLEPLTVTPVVDGSMAGLQLEYRF